MTTFKVEGIQCSHCVAAIKKAVREVAPAASVDVDPVHGEVKVEPAADRSVIAAAIAQAGYDIVGVR